jgi:glycine/D-amino acid oxidase-like deaminating enzyme
MGMSRLLDADTAVVGSGIVGTMTALALLDARQSVLVIEQDEPGAGTASGSAGYVHDGEIFPVAQPALLAELPRLLFDPFGPLVFRISYLPHMLGWGTRFLGSMRRSVIERATAGLASLNRYAIETLLAVADVTNTQRFIVHGGGLKVAKTKRAFAGFERELELLRNAGIPAQPLDSRALRDMEPALADDNAGAIFFPNSAHCVDPAEFGRQLAARIRASGNVVRARAQSLKPQSDGSWLVHVQHGPNSGIHVQNVIVTAGYASPALLQPLGYRVPIAPARGYHLMIEDPGVTLRHPIIFHESHVGATPMSAGVRLAGTMEFAAPEAPADYRRATMLYEIIRDYIPGLRNAKATTWMGIRPSAPDSLPCIGKATRHGGLFYCFGHGHLGLTQAAISARCIVDAVLGRTPPIDLAPFDLARFQ